MANRKLTELPTLSPINFDSTDLLYIVDVQTDTSKKIPYSLLAGDSLIALSAYDSQNTLNITYLSGSIETNTFNIAALDSDTIRLVSDIAYLSGEIDENYSNLFILSTDFVNSDISTIASDVLQLSGDLNALSATVQEFVDDTQLKSDFDALTANVAILSADVVTNTTNIGNNTVTIANIRTLSGFTGTVSTSALTATHYVPIIINGASYNLLLNQ